MPNPYFKFKQFTVFHDRCAMKVGTDGVLLGAWTNIDNCERALDIGTGSGLIALMMAQRNNKLSIDAIDIDNCAFEQAKDNIKLSPFANQIDCINNSLQELQIRPSKKYDIIVSNPPFFIQSLKSPKQERTIARHTDTLSAEELVRISSTLLNRNGKISVIYPFSYKNSLLNIAKEYNLFVTRITTVYPTPTSLPKRILMEISNMATPLVESELIIEKERHIYSDAFIELVKDYYLKM
ncbi:methyltransferase [Dysgonomonas sp. Marseille-P4677]|uniref:tRNA1(Val) (adenine(37)-N6)-methyltransferase n=1 Tax=Dysgonomonas sp. Marseille-P4677 TaxID=2364790 RepID=UPI00191127ED|nr:methyltransferase [Dysgonomonas sp. Marseille-P4677]MBK5719492.1 methyltransferase [Dysgonomonas sp. Marseille-P4677]